jgi:hypothetical protein
LQRARWVRVGSSFDHPKQRSNGAGIMPNGSAPCESSPHGSPRRRFRKRKASVPERRCCTARPVSDRLSPCACEVKATRSGRGAARSAPSHRAEKPTLSRNIQLCRSEGIRSSFLIECIEISAQREQSRDALDDLPEPFALVVGQRLVVTAIGLTVAEPFF